MLAVGGSKAALALGSSEAVLLHGSSSEAAHGSSEVTLVHPAPAHGLREAGPSGGEVGGKRVEAAAEYQVPSVFAGT